MIKLIRKFLCLIGDHEWTCKAAEGIAPTKENITNFPGGFLSYASMYCKYCGYVSELSAKEHEDF
jgi:hypothetical protein